MARKTYAERVAARHFAKASELEKALPPHLFDYTGYADAEQTQPIDKPGWRSLRNKAKRLLRTGSVPKVHRSVGEQLLEDVDTLLLAILSDDRTKQFHDQTAAIQKRVRGSLIGLGMAKLNRQAGAAKARACATAPAGRPRVRYLVTDAQGRERVAYGIDAVAELTGYSSSVIRTRMSVGEGVAQLGVRNPETMQTVKRAPLGTKDA